MSGFFGGLLERKAAGSEGQATAHAVSQSPSRFGLWSSASSWDVERAINDAYERNYLVYRCIDAIATNQSSIPIVHRDGDAKTGSLLRSPKLMRLLNVRPNKYETAAQFRYRLSSISQLSRKGVFIEIVGDPTDPESLHLLPPQSVEPIPHPTKFVEGYWVRSLGGSSSDIKLKPEQVIWLKVKPHPTDPYQCMTPLGPAAISIETDILARLFNRNFLRNDGRPGLLISVRGQIGAEDAQELKRRFGGGPQAAGQISVIEGEGLDVVDMGATPRDAQWTESIATSKTDILKAFGVPESVMGDASGRTFDNADAEYENFWKHTMLPHCEAISGALDVLTGDVNDTTVLAFDYSGIDVLQRQERARQAAIIDRWMQGAITWNEMRDEIGMEQWPEALAANIIVLPSGFAMTKDPADQAKIMELPNMNQPGGDPGKALSDIARQGARIGSREGSRQLGNVLAARALQLAAKAEPVGEGDAVPFSVKHDRDDVVEAIIVPEYVGERKQVEAAMQGMLMSLSSRQASVVTDRLSHVKSRKGTRHWDADPETKAANPKPLDPFYAMETTRWAQDARDDFQRLLRPVLRREARRVARDMSQTGFAKPDVDTMHRLVEDVLDEFLDVVEQSVNNQSNRVANKIKELDAAGQTLEAIQKEVRALIGQRSSWRKTLSGHVTTGAVEGVREAIYGTAGDALLKTWNTEEDEKVRNSHFFANGKTLKMSELFWIGETMMRRPGDPRAPIHEVANCRCYLTYTPNPKFKRRTN